MPDNYELLPTLPTIPTVVSSHGDILGSYQPRRFDPLAEYGPSAQDIQSVVNRKEQENKRGLLWDLLAIPDKIAGQTVKGFVRGLGEGGISGALEGAARGSAPAFLSDWLLGTSFSRETTSVDIRRAWGDQSDMTGAANFFINLGIDAALDPVAWLLTPFGKTAQGAAKAMQAAEEIKTATMAAKAAGGALPREAVYAIQDAFRVSASVQKAVDVGDRAAFVLQLPFAKAPFFETNLGFKSISLGIGKAIDSTMGAVRAGPIGDAIRVVKSDYLKTADPEKAAAFSTALRRGHEADRRIVAMAAAKATENPKTFDYIASHPQYHDAIFTFAEADIPAADATAQISALAEAPDLVLRRQRFTTAMETDPVFRSLYEKATSVKADDIAFVTAQKGANLGTYEGAATTASDALNTLYRKYTDLPLPKEYLDAAGLPARQGVEISAFNSMSAERTTATDIALAHPNSLSSGEAMRAAADATTENAGMAARNGAIDKFRQDVKDILALPPEEQAHITKWLGIHKQLMKEQARMEAVAGVMNASFEHHASPYMHRIATPEVRKHINDFARQKINSAGAAGISVTERFMKNREYTDLLAIEANAVAWEVGTKATGYAPLKKLMEEHGNDGFWAWVFDKPFIRDLWKKDPEAAQFLSTNPVFADYSRISAGGRAVGKVTMLKGLFDSVLKKTTTKLSDVASAQELTAKNMVGIMEVGAPGRPYKVVSPQDLIQEGVSAEVASRYEIAHAMIGQNLDARIRVNGANFDAEIAGLKDALNINHKMSPRDLAQAPGESYASSNMKGAAREIQDAQARLDSIKEFASTHAQISSAGTISSSPSKATMAKLSEYGRRYDTLFSSVAGKKPSKLDWVKSQIALDLEESSLAVKEARSTYDAVRRGVQENIRSYAETSRDAAFMMKGAAAEQKSLLSAQRGAGLTPSKFNQELVLWHRLRKDGRLALDEAQNFVMSDGSKLIDKLPPDADVHWFDRKEWESAVRQIDEVYKPDALRETPVARALDFVKSVWAPYTTVNPLFLNSRVRDQATNVLQLLKNGFKNFGVYPEAVATRWQLHKAIHEGPEAAALDAVAMTRTAADGTIESVTRKKLLDVAQSMDVVTGQSMFAADLADTGTAYASRHAPADAANVVKGIASAIVPFQPGMNSPVIRWGAKFAGALDDTSRLAGFMDAWKRGMSFEQAADHVHTVLYNGLKLSTSLERSIFQRVIPFYGFAKWAIGQTVDDYIKRPGFLDMLGKVRDNAYISPPFGGAPLDPAQVDTILPQFLKDGLGIPYRNTPEGPRFFALGGYLPVGEISQLVAGLQGMFDPKSTNGMLNYIGSKMNPAIKVPLEEFLNRDLFTDKEIEAIPGEQRDFMGMTVPGEAYQLLKQVRFVSELGRLGILTRDQAKTIIQAQQQGEKPIGEREQLPFFEKLVGSAFGFTPKTYLVDVANDSIHARAKQEDAVQEARSLLKSSVLRSEGSPAAAKNMEALRTVLADKYADTALLSSQLQQYSVDERMQKKALRSRDKAALNALRSGGR